MSKCHLDICGNRSSASQPKRLDQRTYRDACRDSCQTKVQYARRKSNFWLLAKVHRDNFRVTNLATSWKFTPEYSCYYCPKTCRYSCRDAISITSQKFTLEYWPDTWRDNIKVVSELHLENSPKWDSSNFRKRAKIDAKMPSRQLLKNFLHNSTFTIAEEIPKWSLKVPRHLGNSPKISYKM